MCAPRSFPFESANKTGSKERLCRSWTICIYVLSVSVVTRDSKQEGYDPHPCSPPTCWGWGHSGSVNCMCCKVSVSKHIHLQNMVRAWHTSLIAALLQLIQNIQTCQHCVLEMGWGITQFFRGNAAVVNCGMRFWWWLLPCRGEFLLCQFDSLCLPFLQSRCFWLDGIQWPQSGDRPLLLRAPFHFWSSDALPGSVHLHANTRQFGDRDRYVCYVHGHQIPHLPPTSISRFLSGPRQPIPDQLTFVPPLLRNLRRVLSVLHDLRRRPVPPAHPPPLHQCFHRIDTPQPQPSQPKRCGWGRREPQQLPNQHGYHGKARGSGLEAILNAFWVVVGQD